MNPVWPAFIHHGSEPSLTYVSDEEEWQSDPDLSAWPYEEHDRLIDSEGWEYRLLFVGKPGKGHAVLEATGSQLEPHAVSVLVEKHFIAEKWSVSDYKVHLEGRIGQGTRAIVAYLAGRS